MADQLFEGTRTEEEVRALLASGDYAHHNWGWKMQWWLSEKERERAEARMIGQDQLARKAVTVAAWSLGIAIVGVSLIVVTLLLQIGLF